MENHVSRWFNVQTVPESHTFSIEDRPGKKQIPLCRTIPIIDLANSERMEIVQEIIKASQEYGFFQVTNHGVPEDVINGAVKVLEELFTMPVDEISKEANSNGWVYMGSTSFATKVPICGGTTLNIHATLWNNPCKIGPKSQHGLGLEKGYLGGISQVQFLTASNYPPCPDPSLTLGLLKHFDHSLITILFQGNVEGLQVLKDGKWIGVEVVPNAFVVNIGTQVEIISNGKLRSAQHRVVTNKEEARTTIATFINPCPDCIIEPSKVIVNEANPPLYPPLSFKEFVNVSKPFGPYTDVIQNGCIDE
ncbi:hypothetical protein DH2020_001332 [Rehmannia glutinosa]|uniref:Fe2OG dioxygenase domain-containing protein n=1 Tax=Rehmannia glutinosa TaxID=99300 RepID=A0ABR0XZH5_REHGL